MVVDDDDDTCDMLAVLLGLVGWTVMSERTAMAADAGFDTMSVDIVLTDIGMPEMNGFELLARLRERASADLVVIAITGYGASQARDSISDAGFDGWLVKPFELASLIELLSEISERRKGTS